MSTSLPAPSVPRDARLDVLRGLALVMVWIDHFEALAGTPVISRWTLHAWGPSDAAELFVLLSGYVMGWSYSRRLAEFGWCRATRRTACRAATLYAAIVLAGGVTLALAPHLGLTNHRQLFPSALTGVDLTTGTVRVAVLAAAPLPLQILLLYLVLLPLAPTLLLAFRRWPLTIGLVSLTIYLASQPALLGGHAVRWPWRSQWYFDPFAWQLVYLCGLGAGQRRFQREGIKRQSAEELASQPSPWLRWGAISVLFAGGILRPDGWTTADATTLSHELRGLLAPLTAKPMVAPIRLLHALAIGWLLIELPSRAWSSIPSAVMARLAELGREPLLVYAAGAVLMLPLVPMVVGHPSPWVLLLLEADALALLWLLAVLRTRWRR